MTSPLLGPLTRFVRDGTLPTTAVDGELVVLNLPANNYAGLDAIGTAIWGMLDRPVTVDEVCARLAGQYRGDPAAIRADTTAFLRELVGEGLARVVAD